MPDDNSSISGENINIDDYDDYDATNDQYEIDNYSIIGHNIGKLKRVLGWFGLSNDESFYDIGDWSIDDNVELYNLDGSGSMNNNGGEDVVRILKREKMKKVRKVLIKLIGLIVVGFLFIYIVVNLAIVNKEYSEIKEAHEKITTSTVSASSTSVEDNIFKKPIATTTSSSLSTSVVITPTSSASSKTTTSTNKSKTTSASKTSTTSKSKTTSSTKTTTESKTKSKTKSKTSTKTSTRTGLAPIFEEIWEDAKEIGDELLDGINGLVDDLNHKLQDH